MLLVSHPYSTDYMQDHLFLVTTHQHNILWLTPNCQQHSFYDLIFFMVSNQSYHAVLVQWGQYAGFLVLPRHFLSNFWNRRLTIFFWLQIYSAQCCCVQIPPKIIFDRTVMMWIFWNKLCYNTNNFATNLMVLGLSGSSVKR